MNHRLAGIYGIVPSSYQPTIFNQADGLMF